MKLVPIVDFVLERKNMTIDRPKETIYKLLSMIFLYAAFLKQSLKLYMLIPCDKNNNPIEKPIHYELYLKYGSFTQYGESIVLECKKYKEALERVYFKDFEANILGRFCYNNELSLDEDDLKNMTIENLTKYNLELTNTAIKQFWL